MQLILLSVLIIGHCLYMYSVKKLENGSSVKNYDYDPINEYTGAILWPLILLGIITFFAHNLLTFLFKKIKSLYDTIGDLYWDVIITYTYIKLFKNK